MDKRWCFPQLTKREQFIELFELTEAHKLLGRTFQGNVSTAEECVALLQSAHVFGIIFEDELVGFSWINMFLGRAAAVHICLWPTAPKEHRVQMGQDFLSYILHMPAKDEDYYVDCLFGLVPETHDYVGRYAEKLGMKYQARIPYAATVMGETVSLAIYTVTRDEFCHGGG